MENRNQRLLGFFIIGVIGLLALGEIQDISDDTILFLVLLLPTVICHEVAHGAVAYAFGDDTAKLAGRLTANPLKHIDLFGTILMPTLFLLSGLPPFGYAKPVPVDLSKLREPRSQGLMVGLAGPFTNFVLTSLTVALIGLLWQLGFRGSESTLNAIHILLVFGQINIIIGVFNLLPIPPLDGSSIIEFFLPKSMRPAYFVFRRYAMFLLLFVILFSNSALDKVLTTVQRPFVEAYVQGIKCVTVGCETSPGEVRALR